MEEILKLIGVRSIKKTTEIELEGVTIRETIEVKF